jgi:S1-C subfamily serine protease
MKNATCVPEYTTTRFTLYTLMKSYFPVNFVPAVAACGLALGALVPVSLYAEAPASLVERQAKINQVMATSAKAVVGIGGIGSGVITSKDGVILSAAHVLDAFMGRDEKVPDTIPILLADGRKVKAKILGRDRDRDSAMAKIVDPGEYPFVDLADPESIKEGDWCIAMGHPGGFMADRTAPVRLGRVWDKNDKKFFRSDCTVSGGDSGGPLFSMDGKLIGIHSNIGQQLTENRHVPVGAFKSEWEKLEKGDTWGDLGKLIPGADRFDRGEREERSGDEPKKPQAKEGSKPKEKESKPMAEPKKQEDAAESAPAPSAAPQGRPSLGVGLKQDTELPTVDSVQDDSAAAKAGIQVGDVVKSIAGIEVKSMSEMVEEIRRFRPGSKLKIGVQRGSETKELDVTLGAK